MIAWKLLWACLAAFLFSKNTAGWEVKCEAGWPSWNHEKCPFEGEEYRPKLTAHRAGRGNASDLASDTVDDTESEFEKHNPKANRTDLDVLAPAVDGDDNAPAPIDADVPAWPNKWTTRPCCMLSCACYKFAVQKKGKILMRLTEDWKKMRCCHEKMRLDKNCVNPPPFSTGFEAVPPPWCLK